MVSDVQKAGVLEYVEQGEPTVRIAAHGVESDENRRFYWGVCDQSRQPASHTDLDCRLCADELWHGRDHGGAGA